MNMCLGKCNIVVHNDFIEITKIDNNKVVIINKQKVIVIEETQIKQDEFEFIVQLDGSLIISFVSDAEQASKIKWWVYNI